MRRQDMIEEGWAALYLCITRTITVEQSFAMMDGNTRLKRWEQNDIDDISKYRETGKSWKEIAEIFHTSKSTVQRMYKYYTTEKERKNV